MTGETEAILAEDILLRVASYMDSLAGHVFDIEETLGDTVSTQLAGDHVAIQNLQVLDFLRQSLEDLAMMALILRDPKTRPFTDETIKKAGNRLKLKATRNLLDGTTAGESKVNLDNLGELDLF
ncbi:MAG: hypothetical protein R8G34_03215 [Paracoccaceae bacterium]|nr:hypothetical protein [Paracoccaceae bacterium]